MPRTEAFVAKTWDQIDWIVDTDTLALRDYAWQATKEIQRLAGLVDDLRHELRLARRHLDNCPTAVAIDSHDADKARSNRD